MANNTIQKIFRAFEPELTKSVQAKKHRKAIYCITHCRTEMMGESYYACDDRHEGIRHFHSCRHRSCYLCAQRKRLEWIESQKSRLFNTPHFHVVFTLPHEYLDLWRYNEGLFTQIIFKGSQETLLELIGSERHWGCMPGILMALHTWGRQLTLHPHTHCLVTAGGLNAQGEWVAMNDFLLPSRVLRLKYRGKLQSLIKEAWERGELRLPTGTTEADFWRTYRKLYKKDWSVRVQERYEHAKGVALYLARYCKGGPLNPAQILSSDAEAIVLRYLDHRDQRTKQLKLTPTEFMRRLLLHVPTENLHTVRYYGLYSPAAKRKHARVADEFGTVAAIAGPAVDLKALVVTCKHCGAPATLRYKRWFMGRKAISINNRSGVGLVASGHVQQNDAQDNANVVDTG